MGEMVAPRDPGRYLDRAEVYRFSSVIGLSPKMLRNWR